MLTAYCVPDVLVWKGILSGGIPGFSGRIHNIVDSYHVPCHTILLLYRIKHLYLSYDTLQPASHNILMETKYVWDRPGTMCTLVDALGGHGISKFTVCVYCSEFPYVRYMTRVRVAG